MAYRESKAAQMVAYLLWKSSGQMEILKLMKLLYTAERDALKNHSFPMAGDALFSMPHGPVLSCTLNRINQKPANEVWNRWIKRGPGNEVHLKKNFDRDELFDLSDADIEILDAVWARMGHMTAVQARNFTHRYREWVNPGRTSLPIRYEDVLRAVGKSDPEVSAICSYIEEQRQIDEVFASL